jgi:RHS repeat-associated protein
LFYDNNNLNQLLQITKNQGPETTNLIYDANGNMTQGYTPQGYEFSAVYDAENRLKSLEYTDSQGIVHTTVNTYRADSFLIKIEKFQNHVRMTEVNFVGEGFLPIQERDGNNNIIREYVWGLNLGGGIGGLLSMRQQGQDYQYLYDGKGNVTAVIDSNQNPVATYAYDEFGKVASKTGTLDQPFQFSTKFFDNETGLNYYGYRFYSPALGRWISRDPLEEEGGINLYAFVENDPVNGVDPWGLKYSQGFDFNYSTVAGKGYIAGYNRQSGKNYYYTGKGYLLDLGITGQYVGAWGSGDWTGNFKSFVGGGSWYTGSIFWSPGFWSGKGGWFGFTIGLSYCFPLTAAYEETNYSTDWHVLLPSWLKPKQPKGTSCPPVNK